MHRHIVNVKCGSNIKQTTPRGRHLTNLRSQSKTKRRLMKYIDKVICDMSYDPITRDIVAESTTASILQTGLLIIYGCLYISCYFEYQDHHVKDQ